MTEERAWASGYASRLVDWIRSVVTTAGAAGIAVGVSGGLDSAVVSGLAARAFPETSLGLFLPCGSAERDRLDASLVARAFGLPLTVVDLEPAYCALLAAAGEDPSRPAGADREGKERLARANLKARLRAVTLYYFANRLGLLVAGTGNRSEIAVGYFTKYGDGAADLLPLAGLVKSQVRDLGRAIGVPEEIVLKVPSAGLWPGQTDEAEMGLSYDVLDRYLVGGDVPAEAAERIRAMAARSEHKRRPPLIPDFPEAPGRREAERSGGSTPDGG